MTTALDQLGTRERGREWLCRRFAVGHGARISLLLLAITGCAPRPPGAEQLASPDGRIVLETRADRSGALAYRVRRDGTDVIGWSLVGLIEAGERAPAAVTVTSVERGSGISAEPTRIAAARAPRRYASLMIHARTAGAMPHRIDWELRAYDDGAAFRLVLPPQPGFTQVRIAGERTAFAFPADYRCLGVRQTEYANSHEGDYAPVSASAIRPGMLFDLPLVCRTGVGEQTLALSESGIDTYSAAYLTGIAGQAGVAIKLTPNPDHPGLAVSTAMPSSGVHTPWRVVMIADRPERLLETTLVDDVATPSRIADPSWVRPGKAAWGWWSGLLAHGVANSGHNDATYRHYIDFAARFGLPYVLIDRGWAWRDPATGFADTNADITRTTEGVNMPGLIAYARQRGVRLWLWVNWTQLDPQLDRVLALYQRLGIAGIKVDYIYRQDQGAVAFYHRLLAGAARHRLMVNVHAAFVPRGLDRTWPNFVTQEGVEGAEYNRWSRKITATHNVRLAYARAIIGPMDYAPGAFRNVTPAAFQPRSTAPEVMTTRAQQLALFVAYPSPLTSLADAPSAYLPDGRLAPGADFVRQVPTVWDETRGVAGRFGRWIAVARRKGDLWYVGVVNDEQARTVAIPLGFLGGGDWRVASWTDAAAPDQVTTRAGRVHGAGNLLVPLAASGGAALILERANAGSR